MTQCRSHRRTLAAHVSYTRLHDLHKTDGRETDLQCCHHQLCVHRLSGYTHIDTLIQHGHLHPS